MHSPSEVNRTVMRDTLVFALILAGGFLTRFPSILNIGFISDESVYDYAAYAIGRGITPYVQIMLPHPPLGYLALVAPVILEQGNLLFLRTFNLVTYLIDAAIAFWIFRILYQQSKRSFHPMLAFALFTLYPLPFSTTTPIEFTLFDVPILLGTVLFVKGLTQNSPVHLLIAGALFGVALMIWFTALFFAFSIVSFLVVHRPPKGADRFRVFVKQAVTIVVGGVVVIGTVLGLIIAWGALPNFLVQSVSLQTS
ncbi:MAG TPA: hypothetical protein VE955_01870, partial [Candidatus Dormibacteraeota bacterium]|nr:hypothetical protein [Candidatus Dormibacteraeota bacterium]